MSYREFCKNTALFLAVSLAISECSLLVANEWVGAGDGTNWSDANNWVGGVPDTSGETAVIDAGGDFEVLIDGDFRVGAITVGAGDTLTLGANTLQASPTVVNAGDFILLDGGLFNPAGPVDFSGSGALGINGTDDANLPVLGSAAGWQIRNAEDHNIHGSGRIQAPLLNAGTISADVNEASLYLESSNKTNMGTLEAVSGGILQLQSISISNADGEIVANDGTVYLQGAVISGGRLESNNNGLFKVADGRFNQVTTSGELSSRRVR